MSWQATKAVMEHSQAKGAARLVLCVLAYHADAKGRCAPSPGIDLICAEAKLSIRGTRYAIRELEEIGEIATQIGRGKGNLSSFEIRLPIDKKAQTKEAQIASFEEEEKGQDVPLITPQKGQSDAQKGHILPLSSEAKGANHDSKRGKIEQQKGQNAAAHIGRTVLNHHEPYIPSDATASPADYAASTTASEPIPDDSATSGSTRRSSKRRPIPEYEIFITRFQVEYGMPYQSAAKDFVQFAGLQKKCADTNWELTEANFRRAMENYFGSELGQHTFADLCARFSAFFRSPLDRFGKPVQSANGKPATSNLARQLEEASNGAYRILFGEDRNPQPFVDAEVIS